MASPPFLESEGEKAPSAEEGQPLTVWQHLYRFPCNIIIKHKHLKHKNECSNNRYNVMFFEKDHNREIAGNYGNPGLTVRRIRYII